ncbi:dihydrofolate reductase family protein [Cryptosporangium sp. NPDC051539]|uniref:dihydrofolate reductase family protein n=1 Tax=Cryptosporangium sp. NPDC051539 TaxID=3363962 RepID=UPI0037AA550F
MTRNVVLYELMALDGVADEPGEGEWFGGADERLTEFLGEVISTQDAVLLGRRTFEKWAPYWPYSSLQPFADFINSTRKYVFSSSRPVLDWPGSLVHVPTPAGEFVRHLKQQAGADIGVHGSLTLARSLLADDLVDELRLVVAPSLAGRGTRLFGGATHLQRLELVSSDRTGDCLLLHYRSRR